MPDNLDSLILQNDERHNTLKNIESNSEYQLLKQDEIADNVKELNKTAEMLLLQGDKPEVQKIAIEGISVLTLKGDKGEKGDSPTNEELESLITPLIPSPLKGEKGENLTFEQLTNNQKLEIKGEKGQDGTNGKNGANGKDGYTPIKGTDYFDGEKGETGKEGKQGKKGDNGKDVNEKTLKELQTQIDYAVQRSSKTVSLVELDDVNLTGLTQTNGKYNLGSGGGSSAITLQTNNVNNTSQTVLNLKAGTNMTLTPDGAGGVIFNSTGSGGSSTDIFPTSGAKDGVNLIFTFAQDFKALVIRGQRWNSQSKNMTSNLIYVKTGIGPFTATLDYPLETNDDIYAIT